jgi:chromosomal replication initiation ATPase DnaA
MTTTLTPYARTPARGETHEDHAMMALAVQLVAVAFGVSPYDVASHRRLGPKVVLARQAAMYLAHIGWSWPLGQVAQAFGRDRATVSMACKLVEDRRQDSDLDRVLDACETALRAAPRPGVVA